MINLAETISPDGNAAVQAGAGTGKTWLLTSRIIRLLMAGASPNAILAITFTRKAAAEIYMRISERLMAMSAADEAALKTGLSEIGITNPNAETLHRARNLYEQLLTNEYGLRITTFHAFCQELLRRFPLEADVPPGFALLESTSELQREAWHKLERECSRGNTNQAAIALDTLLRECGGIHNTRQVLYDFLDHRSDWWAYTETQADPVGYASDGLRKTLKISEQDSFNEFMENNEFASALKRYAFLLSQHPISSHIARTEHIEYALDEHKPASFRFDHLRQAFLTKTDALRSLKSGKALTSKLGEDGVNELSRLHDRIGRTLINALDYSKRLRTFELSRAWYVCGQLLLDHYQQLKREEELLDFNDLEWNTYKLLNRSRYADWVQYKLDQRIDHLLVDEFQDTNPTQWRLLLPLLEEMAAGDVERSRSVFIVGDAKQSIYRFRRADPALFDTAHQWIKRHMHARTSTQHISWRASPAIIEFINMIFGEKIESDTETTNASRDSYSIPDFIDHDTHHKGRWGHAELLPLIPRRVRTVNTSPQGLRNPLLQPRLIDEDERHYMDGQRVAAGIQNIIGQVIIDKGIARALHYGDIMILMRDRTQLESYEAALRDGGIPYLSDNRGSFLDCPEIQDIVCLLKTISTPYDNLALATVLKSPIFSCREKDLILLACQDEQLTWYERLQRIVLPSVKNNELACARRLLQQWTDYADRIPVHDLLDRIYKEGNIISRYLHAVPERLHNRVEGNLTHLLELALDVDSGRYPSLARFLSRLRNMDPDSGSPLSTSISANQPRVRVMTIHAAKGLESPVVFLVNAARASSTSNRGSRALIEWPANQAKPAYFHLIGNKDQLDSISSAILSQQKISEDREQANLLYVALTRAQQILFVSGCEPATHRGWYGFIEERLRILENSGKDRINGFEIQHCCKDGELFNTFGKIQYGEHITPDNSAPGDTTQTDIAIDPALTRPLETDTDPFFIAPSHIHDRDAYSERGGDRAGRRPPDAGIRGTVIHRLLDMLSIGQERNEAIKKIRCDFGKKVSTELVEKFWQEAFEVVNDPGFKEFFDASHYREARNEVPILYRHDTKNVFGIVDRLVIRDDHITLIDYKTHAQATPTNMYRLAEAYYDQLRLYAQGARILWPETPIRALLLFTACRGTVEVLRPN